MAAPMRLLLFFMVFVSLAVAMDSTECPIQCMNNSTCTKGSSDFSDHPTKDGVPLEFHVDAEKDGYHCACPHGFTGVQCGRKYANCNDGLHKCYHGGQCLEGLEDIYGNEQLYCDCSEALDETGMKYVGKYCEIPTTQSCDTTGSAFCVNGGLCQSSQASPESSCRCNSDHEGLHCEFDKGAVPPCSLECEHGGQCKLGVRTDDFRDDESLYNFWKNHSSYQYCDCPQGTFGLRCEVKSSRCGQHHCFHGGECVETRQLDGTMLQHCDCGRAQVKDVSYVGQFCQYERDEFCHQSTVGKQETFCLNGGSCSSFGSSKGCDCPEGFHGPICEFEGSSPGIFDPPTTPPVVAPTNSPVSALPTIQNTETTAEKSTVAPTKAACSLQCRNGGLCRKGVKDTSFLDKFGSGLSHYNVSHSPDFEHCICPDGFTGLTCEHKIEICGDEEHVCFHGSTCKPNDSGDGHTCDCNTGSTALEKLAGKFCEHKSTTVCSETDSTDLGRRQSFSFCVNNGVCKHVVTADGGSHSTCECRDGYFGEHCELAKEVENESGSAPPPSSPNRPQSPLSNQSPTFAPGSSVRFTADDYRDGLDPSDFFAIIGGVVAFIAIIVVVMFLRRRTHKGVDTFALDEESHLSIHVSPQTNLIMDYEFATRTPSGRMRNVEIL